MKTYIVGNCRHNTSARTAITVEIYGTGSRGTVRLQEGQY